MTYTIPRCEREALVDGLWIDIAVGSTVDAENGTFTANGGNTLQARVLLDWLRPK